MGCCQKCTPNCTAYLGIPTCPGVIVDRDFRNFPAATGSFYDHFGWITVGEILDIQAGQFAAGNGAKWSEVGDRQAIKYVDKPG